MKRRVSPGRGREAGTRSVRGAAGRRPAANHGVQRLRGLDLHPTLAARADVKAVGPLANDAFQVLLPGQIEKLFAIFQR